MINKAIIEETEQVYFINKKIIDLLGAHMFDDDNILVGVGFRHFNKMSFDEVYYDGVKYVWVSGGMIPDGTKIRDHELYEYGLGERYDYQFDDFSKYENDVIKKILLGSEICSVSEYKRDEESYKKRMREKKLKRIT
jgi:hypothetical protein